MANNRGLVDMDDRATIVKAKPATVQMVKPVNRVDIDKEESQVMPSSLESS
jgi:hypothetical protein